jgi:hypothetical protein
MGRFVTGVVTLQGILIGVTLLLFRQQPEIRPERLLSLDQISAVEPPIPLDRYGLPSTDLNATLRGKDDPREVWISVRPGCSLRDYETRRTWDLAQICGKDPERQRVFSEDSRSAKGYGVRFKGRGKIYAECVRLRGDLMVVVRVSRSDVPPGRENLELDLCGRALGTILSDLQRRISGD